MKQSPSLQLLLYLLFISFAVSAQDLPSIKDKTNKMEKYEGYMPFYWDEENGKIWLEVSRLNQPFLYYPSLAAGTGSNDIGLDRGLLGQERALEFRKSGRKLLLIEPNTNYRAESNDPQERQAVSESFAESVIHGFTVAATTRNSYLVDATDFLMQDHMGFAERIQRTNQGNFSLDLSRSAFYLDHTKNFPENTEFEVTLTYTGSKAGSYLRSVSPNSNAVTVRVHHSFVQLPDDNYEPRPFDPRSGFISMSYYDYATPVSDPIVQRFITRHRLEKKNPEAEMSKAVEPIVYYMDPGAPEPIRSALMDGMRWWNQAFEAAGYKDAFQVKLLPEDADPMDIRYNLVQWVHRSTRGWSYGTSVTDPRTGEIIKGKVTLGSLRVRQDFLIASGLVADYQEGKPVSNEMLEMALQRLRQLAAHEVGHTLGLVHNYAASYNDRASVMDYPHPLVTINDDNTLSLNEAYTNEIGAWDKVAITYGYQDFPEGVDEPKGLNEIIQRYIDNGLKFISDRDARATGGAHPVSHLWDNGGSAVDELNRTMEVRKIALENFSLNKIPVGQPVATLEEALVPIYLFHRYQAEAAAKLVGGLNYSYAVRGDGQMILEPVSAGEQQEAIASLLQTLEPEALTIPEKVLELLPPYPLGYRENSRELFPSHTGITFDPVAAAESAANMVLGLLMHPQRTTRMIDLHARYSDLPGFNDLMNNIVEATLLQPKQNGYAGEMQRLVDRLVLDHTLNLAANHEVAGQVRAIAELKVQEMKTIAVEEGANAGEPQNKAHWNYLISRIAEYEKNPDQVVQQYPLDVPDGSPIGQEVPFCSHQ